MSESLPPETSVRAGLPKPPAEAMAYRPISGFAVAGFIAAGVFVLLVLIAGAVALYQGTPFFYTPWIVLLPAAGLVLSLLARGQIRGSEGTRAGERLADAGIWMSLLFGLGYFVYFYVTGLAVQSQANAFLMELGPDAGFFPHLLKAADPNNRTDYYAAFLETLAPGQRGSVRPEDEAGMLRKFDESKPDGTPGLMAGFHKHFLTRLITTAPKGQVQIEPLGVQFWDYEDKVYKVRRIYRVTTPEAAVDISIAAWSNEGESAGEQRKWYLPLSQVIKPSEKQIKRTPMGEGLRIIRFSTGQKLARWRNALNDGEPFAFVEHDKTSWERLSLNERERGYVRVRVQDLFQGTQPRRLEGLTFNYDEEVGFGNWTITSEKKVQMLHGFRVNLDPQGDRAPVVVEGTIIVETQSPIDPASLAGTPKEVDCVITEIRVNRTALLTAKKGDRTTVPQ